MAPRRKVDRVETAQARMKRLERELEQARQDAAVEAQEKAKEGPEMVAAAFLFKWSMARLARGNRLHEDYAAVAVQKQPKEAIIARDADMSETERENIIDKMKKAIAAL